MNNNNRSPKQVLEASSRRVRKVVNEILSIEQEYQGIRNPGAAGVEKAIAKRIRQLIDREVRR